MSNLVYRQQKIQEKRKQTPWRVFVMEICSWSPMSYYKNTGKVSIFPDSNRINGVDGVLGFEDTREKLLSIHSNGDFFGELEKLQSETTFPCVRQYGTFTNSDYSDTNANVEHCFLTRCSVACQNVLYSLVVKKTSNVIDAIKVQGGEGNIYSSTSIDGSLNVFYSRCIENSSNIWFSSNLIGCNECLFCENLESKSYAINNKEYSKEEYFQKKASLLSQKINFDNRYHDVLGEKYKTIHSTDTQDVYGGTHIQEGKNCFIVGNPIGTPHIYDTICTGTLGNYYACADSGVNSEYIYASVAIVGSNTIFYSQFLENCSFCLGCIGLKNKSYCILNKQYSKEERYQKIDEIFAQMDAEGTLGQFFPATMNPFYFNDTAAYLIDPSFTKEELVAKGYLWRDEPIKVDVPEGVKVISISELADYERRIDERWYIDPEILKVIIQDESGNVYRIVKMEYDFLMKYGLPLPRKHWLERMKENFKIS